MVHKKKQTYQTLFLPLNCNLVYSYQASLCFSSRTVPSLSTICASFSLPNANKAAACR
ncbi:hypothetical protein Hanom_Chr04g00307381 [Helianthus anomalus]